MIDCLEINKNNNFSLF